MLNALPSLVSFNQIALEQGSESLTAPELLSVRYSSSFDSLRCIINTLACPEAMIHFLWRQCQLSKRIKKESKLDILAFCIPPLICYCFLMIFLCSLIPLGHLVGSSRTAVESKFRIL